MTDPNPLLTTALAAYDKAWNAWTNPTDETGRKVFAFNAAFDAAKAQGADNQEAVRAADAARDRVRT